MEQQNYKVQPFDLDTALANPEWVYLDDGRKVIESAHLKLSGRIAVAFGQGTSVSVALFDEKGRYRDANGKLCILVLHVPVKKMKITVFVYPHGLMASYTEWEAKNNWVHSFAESCEQAEKGLCTRHEFEVEVNEPTP